uniref:Uncharacterized protein n=2 Tax=unclassified Caudoviricetes TaxID=2788787 RepID=A0A8S5PIX4_9CAUD|nr:MAG TPA: hypothetical protein [Siphoviridae sp. ctJcm18]DAE06672.1 MAG TPA: hypothetical protein [Siphoviridae sp. ctUGQ45]
MVGFIECLVASNTQYLVAYTIKYFYLLKEIK